MLSADKIREIAKRSKHNIYDEQLRIMHEEILESAKRGNGSYSIFSQTCEKEGFDYDFWFNGARNNTSEWEKFNLSMKELGYVVSFDIRKFDDMMISIFW